MGDTEETAPVPPELVRAHVARVLRSETFSKAPSLRRLLSYVVDQSVGGRADSVKEYSIGVEVFGRGESFDPRADTIVRVQARRLRSKLGEYYAVEGFADGLEIELPERRLPAEVPVRARIRAAQTAHPGAWLSMGCR